LITPTNVPQQVPYNVQSNDYQPSLNDLNTFDRGEVLQIIKEFLLRQFLKKEVKANEDQQIVTDVTVVDMQDSHTIYGHNQDTVHFAASINKLPVTLLLMEELQAHRITLDTTMNWQVSDQRAGNGVYDQPGAPTTATLREVLHDMLNRSGNTAVRIIVNGALGGAAAVNNRLAAMPELQHTRLIPLDANRFYLGNTTSKESLWTLRKILSQDASYAQDIRDFLATNIFEQDGVRSQLAGNDYITLVNKTGLLYDPDGDNFHDVGIIYNTKTHKSYGYAMLTTAPDASPTAPPRADQSLKDMGRDILRFSGDKPVRSNAHGVAPQTLAGPQGNAEHGKVLY
jgi:beta-lactamase class A